MAKLAVSALIFDYILTGPITSVSAGQYLVGLVLEIVHTVLGTSLSDRSGGRSLKQWGSVVIAFGVTCYFFRQNLIGIHESSDKALKIMIATTVMAVSSSRWCGVTLDLDPAKRAAAADRGRSAEEVRDRSRHGAPRSGTGRPCPRSIRSPAIRSTRSASSATGCPSRRRNELRGPGDAWLSLVGLIGILIAFGHSILAMSGEETLAQVYREVESPKLPNFKKAAFIVFVFSLFLTGSISFLAVMIIPDDVRMPRVRRQPHRRPGDERAVRTGPSHGRSLLLNAFVVVVGFLILSGAVNTAIIGSNGVLNRVAEDGVLPDWFLKPHPNYGTTYRILFLILGAASGHHRRQPRRRARCWARPTPSAWSGASCSWRCRWWSCASAGRTAARVQGAAQHSNRRRRNAARPDPGVPRAVCAAALSTS